MRPDGAGPASTTNAATWGTFAEAFETARAGKADGIGYVFAPDDPFVGVDLDHCLDGDDLHPDAGAIVLALDSYTERSVGGDGCHVIVRADLNGSRNRTAKTRWGGSFECYGAGRYFWMTGDPLRGCPTTIGERQAELDEVISFVFPKPAEAPTSAVSVSVDLDDQDLLDGARQAKNGADFDRLWNGDIAGYDSRSEADLGLCGHLVFWAGRDPDRIDRLFRSSALMREKWDARRGEKTYGRQTIETAIAGCWETYQPPSQVRPASSSRVRPQLSSSLRPSPYGGDEHEQFVPGFVPDTHPRVHSWRPESIVAIAAQPPQPPELIGLFYPGYNHLVSGESEALKTWLMLAAAAAELRQGRGVLWVDGDDVGPGALLERLLLLGAGESMIDTRYAYVRPDEPLTEERLVDVLDVVREHSCRLAVFDGFNPLLALHGLDPNSGSDVEGFYRHIDPIRKLGVATALTDNVVKSREARGRWAIGSERKKSKAEVHLGMQTLTPLVRGGTGRAKIEVHKDRPGHLVRPTAGILVIESGLTFSWRIDPDDSRDDQGEFRPTELMLKVSRHLEARWKEPQSRNAIEQAKLGRQPTSGSRSTG